MKKKVCSTSLVQKMVNADDFLGTALVRLKDMYSEVEKEDMGQAYESFESVIAFLCHAIKWESSEAMEILKDLCSDSNIVGTGWFDRLIEEADLTDPDQEMVAETIMEYLPDELGGEEEGENDYTQDDTDPFSTGSEDSNSPTSSLHGSNDESEEEDDSDEEEEEEEGGGLIHLDGVAIDAADDDNVEYLPDDEEQIEEEEEVDGQTTTPSLFVQAFYYGATIINGIFNPHRNEGVHEETNTEQDFWDDGTPREPMNDFGIHGQLNEPGNGFLGQHDFGGSGI